MRYLLILLITVNLYSQDYLITLSGKTTEGRYIDVTKTSVLFQQKGSNVVSNIPIVSVIRVALADGTVVYEQGELSEKYGKELEQKLTKESANAKIRASIIGNKNSMKYHRGYVGHLPDESDRLVFISTKDAELKNYNPCSACFDTRPSLTDYYLEKEVSMTTNASIRSRYEVIYEHEDLDYVNRVMNKIIDNWVEDLKGYDYRILIIRDDSPNAFAVAGGNIYLTTGILKMFEDESEMEFVIAHEISHVERRHTLREYRKAQRLQLIAGIFTALTGVGVAAAGGDVSDVDIAMDIADAVSQFGAMFVIKGYSRDLEQEADIYAQIYASKNNMDKIKLAYALDKLATRSKRLGQGITANAFSDHPGLQSRINQINNSELIELDKPIEVSAELNRQAGVSSKGNISVEGGKDVLVTISGKGTFGIFKQILDDKVVFQSNGSNFPSKIPKNLVKKIILADGTVVIGDAKKEVTQEMVKEDLRLLSFKTNYIFIGPSSNKPDHHIITLVGDATNHSYTKDLRVKDFYFQDFSIADKIIKFANMKSFALQTGITTGFASNIQLKSSRVSTFMQKLKNKKIKTVLTVEEVKIEPGVGAKKKLGYSIIPTITSLR